MASLNTTKVDGNTVSASEWNQFASINNFITNSGQTASTSNLQQMGIASARYSSAGQHFEDTSAGANAYILSPVSPFKSPVSSTAGEGYFTGMRITFKTANANTGASTVNVNSLGTKTLKKSDGSTDVETGDIPSGQYVTFIYNGTNFVKVGELGYQLKSIQTFISSGTWTKSNGIRAIMVEVQGGGGGGAGVNNGGAGSGGAGGYSKKFITTGIGATETVTIGGGGAGGTGGVGTATSGTAGSTSSFGSHCSATGGGGGTTGGGAGGAGGVGLSGTINLTGNPGNGRPSNSSWNGGDIGINGGASIFGGAGIGGRGNVTAGSAATNSGSGGGASYNIVGYNAAGGAGAAGIVIVHEYV